jgi:apolipoprotein N-acyltransferase
MPNFDVGVLGWVALVPLLLAIQCVPERSVRTLALPFGIIWSIGVHNWYPDVLGPAFGYALVVCVGSYYSLLIAWGVTLQRKLPAPINLLALPVLWSAVEFVKYVAPILEDWWFVWLANSQWRIPAALQVLSVTGLPGLSFLLMLANVAVTALLWRAWREHKIDWSSIFASGGVAAIVVWGALTIPPPPTHTFGVAATADLSFQAPDIKQHGKTYPELQGPYTITPEMSQTLFDVNAALTRQVAGQGVAFVVWPENKLVDVDDPLITGQLGTLARQTGAYIVADVVWHVAAGMYNTAVLVGPHGQEVGRRAKIAITGHEKARGFTAGPRQYPVYDTPYGKVGIGVCWDRHRLWITRELARAGAQIVLMPVDDDFNRNRWFPPFHAADGVFRAVENRVTVGLGTTSGVSLIVDPYGRINAQSGINERAIITGQTFVVPQRPLYTRWGDWFGWMMVVALLVLTGAAVVNQRNIPQNIGEAA